MYTFDGRVRYSEVGSDGRLTIESLINYFQDCSTFQSEDLDIGIRHFQKEHMAWVLSAWQIVIHRFPELGENILVGTLPYELRGFMGMRNFCIKTQAGEMLAVANSVWTLINTDIVKPTRIPTEISDRYTIEEKLPMEYAPRKITLEGSMEDMEDILVKKHHLDTNLHVNNGQYIRMAMDCVGEEPIRQLRAEYKKSAVLGDIIHPAIIRAEGKDIVILQSEDRNAPYCIVELERR